MMMNNVVDGKLVKVHYTLTIKDKFVDSSREGEPLEFQAGSHEKAISTLNGTTLMDRAIIVNEARPRTFRDRSGGFKNQTRFNKRGSGLGNWR